MSLPTCRTAGVRGLLCYSDRNMGSEEQRGPFSFLILLVDVIFDTSTCRNSALTGPDIFTE